MAGHSTPDGDVLYLLPVIIRDERVVTRDQLPDSDPESWPSQWRAAFGTDLLEIFGPTWRECLEGCSKPEFLVDEELRESEFREFDPSI